MSRTRKTLLNIVLIVSAAVYGYWFFYETFINGTTEGPDFIQAVNSGAVSSDSISSIEVIEPTAGHTPFTLKEYDSLRRRKTIIDESSISRFLALCRDLQSSGHIHQNHPHASYEVYLKVNCGDGFFLLYVKVLEDQSSSIFYLDANTRNAVNPNGASLYRLDDFSNMLSLLKQNESIDQ